MYKKLTAVTLAALVLGGCLGGYNRPMQLIYDVGPEYPAAARADGIEGRVVVSYDISAEGIVDNVAIVESEPPGVFDEAAISAVTRWRYNAPILDGVSQSVSGVTSTLRFVLDDGTYDDY